MPFSYFTSRERLRRKAAAWLARLQGSIDDKGREAFERWYRGDLKHAEAFDRIRAGVGDAGLLAQTAVGRARSLPSAETPRSRFRYAAAMAAAGILAVSAVVLTERPGRAPASELMLFATTIGEIREIPLADGSRMTLDTDTAVAIDMGRERRQVTLRKGRARFAVAAERRPFLVTAGSSVLTAPHAVFDISLSEDRTVASAIAGALTITVARKGENTPSGPAVELQTGQQASIRPGGTEHDFRTVARRDAIWPTGMLEFEATPLGEAVAQANRYSRAKIRIADPAVERLRVTGAFRAGDIPGVARALGAAFGLRIDRTPSGDYLLFSRP